VTIVGVDHVTDVKLNEINVVVRLSVTVVDLIAAAIIKKEGDRVLDHMIAPGGIIVRVVAVPGRGIVTADVNLPLF
jgi:hypothetical protein